jgi:ATP-dependent helicase/DNAse subunit B
MRAVGDGEEEERMLFQLVLNASKRVELTWSVADASGKVRRPSRFVVYLCSARFPEQTTEIAKDPAEFARRTFGVLPGKRNALQERSESLRRGESRELSAHAVSRLQHSISTGTNGSYDGYLTLNPALSTSLVERLAILSPTRFERYGECPQHFLLTSLLSVRELESPEHDLEINVRKRGTLQHGMLERFYRAVTADEIASVQSARADRLPAPLRAKFNSAVDDSFAEFDARHPARSALVRTLERRRIRRKLLEWVAADLFELTTSGYIPRWFEFRFGDLDDGIAADAPAALLQIGAVTMRIRGSVDRIDFNPAEKRYRIIDYKDGKANRHRNLPRNVDEGRALQLAFYAHAWAQHVGCDAASIEAHIRPLAVPPPQKAAFTLPWGEHHERFNETLELFVSSISNGRFPALPSKDGCKYCAVRLACRTKHSDSETLRLNRFESARALLEEMAQR